MSDPAPNGRTPTVHPGGGVCACTADAQSISTATPTTMRARSFMLPSEVAGVYATLSSMA
jgi:hypothetical protein